VGSRVGDHRWVTEPVDPARRFMPACLDPRGRVGLGLDLDLDAAPGDWDEVRHLVTGSYRLVAPRTLARQVR